MLCCANGQPHVYVTASRVNTMPFVKDAPARRTLKPGPLACAPARSDRLGTRWSIIPDHPGRHTHHAQARTSPFALFRAPLDVDLDSLCMQ